MNMNFSLLIPEITGFLVLLLLLVQEILKPAALKGKGDSAADRRISWRTALIGGVITGITVLIFSGHGSGFSGMFTVDPLSVFFKILFVFTALVLILMSREYFSATGGSASGGRAIQEKPGEFLLVLWTSLMGLFFLVSATDLLLIFVALETFALSLYILTAYLKRSMLSIEAGLKYLLIGSLASAFFIYGISLVYAACGSTLLSDVRTFADANPDHKLLLLGLLFIISGLGFKIASVPFQLWVPDVYEGAPTPVVSYLAVASKSAGFALLLRILFTAFPAFGHEREVLFSVLAVMTLVYGNLGALVQKNIKRLFGYSSIGHAGYLLIALAVGGQHGLIALLYYLIAYAITNLMAFYVLTVAGTLLGSDQIEAYRGLGKRSPWLAGALFIALLSLAGVPPLAGFFGKFLVLLSAVNQGMTWLALIGLLGVAVSLYYYLSVVKTMYFEEPSSETPLEISGSVKAVLTVLIFAIIFAGVVQAPFFAAAASAAKSLF